MPFCLAAILLFGSLSHPGLLQTQEAPEPRRLFFGSNVEVGSCNGTYVLLKRLPDGRCVTAWWFTVEEWKISDGEYKLPVEVRSDFPVKLELYRWDRSAERLTPDGRAVGGKRVGPQLLDAPKGGPDTHRRTDVILKRPGDYLLLVISEEADPEGFYHVAYGIPAVELKAVEPQPNLKAVEPVRTVAAEKFFRNLKLSANEARFAEHVTLTPTLTDLPASCEWQFSGADVVGLLPTGLKLRPNSNIIEGTPRQLGTWTFTYSLRNLRCKGDPTNYGNRSASVTFTVLP